MKKKILIISGMLASTCATYAAAHTYKPIESTHNSQKAVVTLDKDDTIIIKATLIVSGNGAEQNPTSTSIISVDGNQCASRTSNWQDGPNQYDISCTIALKQGTHGVWAREITNQRATASAMTIKIEKAGEGGDMAGTISF